jgi:hypothetical protein
MIDALMFSTASWMTALTYVCWMVNLSLLDPLVYTKSVSEDQIDDGNSSGDSHFTGVEGTPS